MITKKIQQLSKDKFEIYGTYTDMLDPKGVKFGEEPVEFFRDMLRLDLGLCTNAAFSLCRIKSRPQIIEASEYHNNCGEMIIPLDGDILMHVGPATFSAMVPVEDIEIFRIPKGTAVSIHSGVWHQAAFTYGTDDVNILVALPERTYMKDCYLIEIPVDKRIIIED